MNGRLESESPVIRAARSNDVASLAAEITLQRTNEVPPEYQLALRQALKHGSLDGADFLLDHGCEMDAGLFEIIPSL
jgi:hypothetical protein